MSRSTHAAQGESLPYNHHLHQFLTFLKHERGFADATIVNRECSLKTVRRQVRSEVAARSCFPRSMAFAWAKSVGCVLKTSTGRKRKSSYAVPNRGKSKLI